jgi:hypothetical protein
LAEQWRERAACRKTKVDMVPGNNVGGIQRAKKVCSVCPVRVRCLIDAEKMTLEKGAGYTQGVWAGFTEQERATMAVLGRLPEPCTTCGLECVPIRLDSTECSVCRPGLQVYYDDYRMLIEQRVRARKSYQEIADELRLKKVSVANACARWRLKIRKRSVSRQRTGVMPCGTIAAKTRHMRREKKTGNPADGFRNCPQCRLVPWTKGGVKSAA